MGLSSGLAGFLGMIFEGRTQALAMIFGWGRPAASLGAGCLLRQCESLMTRFLGAVAVRTSSSSSLWGMGVFFPLPGRSGLAPTDLPRSCEGFQFGLSSRVFALGVVTGVVGVAGVAGAAAGVTGATGVGEEAALASSVVVVAAAGVAGVA